MAVTTQDKARIAGVKALALIPPPLGTNDVSASPDSGGFAVARQLHEITSVQLPNKNAAGKKTESKLVAWTKVATCPSDHSWQYEKQPRQRAGATNQKLPTAEQRTELGIDEAGLLRAFRARTAGAGVVPIRARVAS